MLAYLKLKITVRNIVVERLCFQRLLRFCSQGGGVSQHALGQTNPPGQTPLLGRHPPDGHCSGQYASYWNAFLLIKCLYCALQVSFIY